MNNINYNNLDLRDRTVYDFTDDFEIIKEIVGDTPEDFYIETCHIINKMADIVFFSELTCNDELYKLATKALKAVQKEWDSLVADSLKNGIIID